MEEGGPGGTPKRRGTYLWGRLFVRLSLVLAILTLVATVLVCLQIGAMAGRRSARNVFKADAGLTDAVDALGTEYKRTMTLFADLYPDQAKGKDFSISLPTTFASKADLDALQMEAAHIRHDLAELRQKVLDQFNTPASSLIKGMRKKVDRAKDKIADKNEAAVARAQRRIQQLIRRMDPAKSFYPPFDHSEYRTRMEAVEACRDLLERMRDMTKSESAHALMATCTQAMKDISDAYPEPLSEAVLDRLNSQIEEQQANIAELRGEGMRMKGEEIAEELDGYLKAINAAFAADWKIDRTLDALDDAIADNQNQAQEAAERRKAARVTAMQLIGCSIVAGLCLAFFLLVVGDFLQAHFDAADYARQAAAGLPQQ
jgi:hypothetical protein